MTSFLRRSLIGSAWLLATLTLAGECRAACSMSVTGVAFGAYDPFSSTSLDSAGNIAVTCDAAYTLTLSAGAGSYAGRQMSNGSSTLVYNLFVDAARSLVWGDGSGGTATVSGSASASTVDYPVYGRLPARQNVTAGSYGDSIVVTLSF